MWDWIITLIVVLGFILSVIANASGRKPIDILRQLRDFVRETKEETQEQTEDFVGYYK